MKGDKVMSWNDVTREQRDAVTKKLGNQALLVAGIMFLFVVGITIYSKLTAEKSFTAIQIEQAQSQIAGQLSAMKRGDLVIFRSNNIIIMVNEIVGDTIVTLRKNNDQLSSDSIKSIARDYMNIRIIRRSDPEYDNTLKQFFDSK